MYDPHGERFKNVTSKSGITGVQHGRLRAYSTREIYVLLRFFPPATYHLAESSAKPFVRISLRSSLRANRTSPGYATASLPSPLKKTPMGNYDSLIFGV